MKEHPILFTAPMVRAILDGRKTQTRRLVKPQPPAGHSFAGWCVHSTCSADEGKAVWCAGDRLDCLNQPHRVRCPYGQPGDQLWVRETVWIPRPRTRHDMLEGADTWPKCVYSADTDAIEIEWMKEHRWKQRPSIHMPRWASRITLEATSVRVERLQDISERDAADEGLVREKDGWRGAAELPWFASPVAAYRSLWESINGAESWSANPWLWVVEFRRIEQEAKAA